MDSKLNISRGEEDHRGTASNSKDKANKEVIAVANELKKIGDKLNSTYKLHFVNRVNLAG